MLLYCSNNHHPGNFSLYFMITRIENFLMERKYFGFRIKAIELISANIHSLYIENFGA